jgi:hypothetical protein
MITPIVLILVSILVLVFLVQLARGRAITARNLEDPAGQIREVDLEAFRNLIDPSEKEFLRSQLCPSDFRRIQRERLRAAADYVQAAARNAAVLLQIAQAARLSPDPKTVASAEKLVDTAVRLRLYAMQSLALLYLGMVFPGRRISLVRIAERYEQMTRQVVMLGLQYPTRGVSAAL